MLTLHKISGSRTGAYAAYLTSIEDTGDYYVGPHGDPFASLGEWLGGLAAAEWGLSGLSVDRNALLAVLEGRDPRTGERIVRVWRADRVAAHDLVFSAPSSVSAVWALAGDDLRAAIQRAQDQAVADAFAYVEREFALVRRRDPTRRRPNGVAPIISEPAAALLGASFAHHTARQTAAQAAAGVPPDPQLHTHVLVPGIARRRDGAFVAINSLELHRRRAEAGAVYRASLAAGLSALGFAIERQTGKGGRYFEIHGVPMDLRQVWSSRHQEIEATTGEWRREFLEQFGREPSIFEQREWAAKTRAEKGRFFRGDLFAFWRDTAACYGVTPEAIEMLRYQRIPMHGRAQLVAELLGKDGVTREHATFDMQSLRIAAYEHAPGLVPPAEVERTLSDVLRDADVMEVNPGVWTTRAIRQLEGRVIAWKLARSTQRAATAEKATPPRLIEEALLRCPVRLSDEQRDALDRILGGSFTALTGEAGTGKGVVLRVAADVWRRQQRRIFAVAVGGAQAQRLAADLGTGVEALTLDAFVWRVEHDRLRLSPSDVVALDEAGQVDTRRWAAFAHAVGAGPTVVALGDHAQLSPISAGGLWPLLATGGPQLTEVRRTTLEWEREAWAHLRRGESAKALGLYAIRGQFELYGTPAEALTAAVAAWDRDGRDGLIVTLTSNMERHRANLQAQAIRWVRRELGEESVSATVGSGMVRFHAGDPVLFTEQYRHPDLDRRVENGTTGAVIAVDPAARMVRVRTNEAKPRDVAITVGEGAIGLDLYYASHVVKSQGTTVRRSYVVAGGWQTSRETLYVACSRARQGTRIFVDLESLGSEVEPEALAELVRRGAESRAKRAATTGQLPRRPAPRPRMPAVQTRAHKRPWHVREHVLNRRAAPTEAAVAGIGGG